MSAGRVVGALALVILAGCTRAAPSEPPREGPVLSVTNEPSSPSAAPRPIAPSTIPLALAGLPPAELKRLREHLAAATDDAIRRAAPTLFLDLDDDASSDRATAQRPALPDAPALTAAANLSGAPWSATGISVDLGPTCNPGSTRCIRVFAPRTSDRLEGRARAVAWALADAAILRAPPTARPALVRSLREKTLAATTIALVFDAPEGDLDEAELGPLRDEARRALRHLDASAPARPWLERLEAASTHWTLPVTLGPGEILVVPRLSALARLGAFEAEVSAAGESTWVVRPKASSP